MRRRDASRIMWEAGYQSCSAQDQELRKAGQTHSTFGPPSVFSVDCLLACLQLSTVGAWIHESQKSTKSTTKLLQRHFAWTRLGSRCAVFCQILPSRICLSNRHILTAFDMANFRYLRTFIDEESSHGAVLYRIPSCPNLGVQIADEKEEEKQWLSDYVTALEVRSQTLTPVLPLPAAQEEIPEMPVPVEGDQVQIQSDAATLPVTTVGNGSRGHPFLCRRPCVRLAKGNCHMGDACGYCHHQTHCPFASLDKRRRVHLRSMDTFSVCYANTFLISGGKN